MIKAAHLSIDGEVRIDHQMIGGLILGGERLDVLLLQLWVD